jgi:hypothetical protein
MTDEMDDATFLERVVKPLRAAEHVEPSFRSRVMSRVHATPIARTSDEAAQAYTSGETSIRASGRDPWYQRAWWIRVTPVSALAYAAGLAALVLFGAWTLRRSTVVASGASAVATRPAAVDTVHLVRFVFADSSARNVSLVGQFNNWERTATQLHRTANGTWIAEVPLRAGRHEYAFIVRDAGGERWVADPFAETKYDEYGTESSIISIGANSTT